MSIFWTQKVKLFYAAFLDNNSNLRMNGSIQAEGSFAVIKQDMVLV